MDREPVVIPISEITVDEPIRTSIRDRRAYYLYHGTYRTIIPKGVYDAIRSGRYKSIILVKYTKGSTRFKVEGYLK